MKKTKIFFFTQLSETSFLSRKLKVSEAREVLLPPQYILFKAGNASLPFDIELVRKPHNLANQQALVEKLEKTNNEIAIVAGESLVASRQSQMEAFAKQLQQPLKEGTWILQPQGLVSAMSSETCEFSVTLLDLNQEDPQIYFDLLSTRPRHFNKLRFENGRVMKTSEWKEKASAEIHFLKSIPESLAEYYPQVLEVSETSRTMSYVLPAIPSFDLGRLLLQNSLSLQNWRVFYQRLSAYFQKLPRKKVSAEAYQEALQGLFIGKLLDRFAKFQEDPRYSSFAKRFYERTGAEFAVKLHSLVKTLREEILRSAGTELAFSHGDLCFSNILYDLENGAMVFVDPRGVLRKEDSFRPWEYDLAKLSQCALGFYDFLVFDLAPSNAAENASAAFAEFLQQNSVDRRVLRLYEASLFWSLLPLHLDDEKRVFDFMLAGDAAFMAGL